MYRLLIGFAVLLFAHPVKAQDRKWYSGPSVETQISNWTSVSAGYSVFRYNSFRTVKKADTLYNGFFAVADAMFGIQFSHPAIYTPSFSVKLVPYFIGRFISRPAQLIAGAGYVYYTDFHVSSPAIRASIGLCILGGAAEVSYAHNFLLSDATLPVSTQGIELCLRFGPLLEILREDAED